MDELAKPATTHHTGIDLNNKRRQGRLLHSSPVANQTAMPRLKATTTNKIYDRKGLLAENPERLARSLGTI